MSKDRLFKEDNKDWILCVYSEAWAQYVHEDTLSEERSMKYLTVTTILLSLFQVFVTILAIIIPDMNFTDKKDVTLIFFMLVVCMIFYVIFLYVLYTWTQVTKAGQEYVNQRFKVILEIEQKYNLEPNIAISENKWREEKKKRQEKEHCKQWLGGYRATQKLIMSFKILTFILIGIDIVCAILLFLL